MTTRIDEEVSVKFTYDNRLKKVYPETIIWHGRDYPVTQVGLHHFFREGRVLKHVFSVASAGTAFRLVLDTETLHWKAEEVSNEN